MDLTLLCGGDGGVGEVVVVVAEVGSEERQIATTL